MRSRICGVVVVLTGGDVGGEGSERVEGRLAAPVELVAHVLGDLVHGHVAGALVHHLHPHHQHSSASDVQSAVSMPVARTLLLLTCTSFSQARRVSSPWIMSSENWASSFASLTPTHSQPATQRTHVREEVGRCGGSRGGRVLQVWRGGGSATTHLMEPGRRPSPIESEMSYLHPINSHTTHQDEAPHGVSMGQASEPDRE